MKKIIFILSVLLFILTLSSCQNNNYSSHYQFNMIDEYYKDSYDIKDNIFNTITYEELINLLESNGNHLILLSDDSSKYNKINSLAKKYEINNIYHFSFKQNGIIIDSDLNINIFLGELLNRYFSNINSFINTDYCKSINCLNLGNIPYINDLLLLYNKDNKIIDAININNDINSFLNKSSNYLLSNFQDDYFIKTIYKDLINENDNINIKYLTYYQLIWLLNQKGKFLILFAGAWCKNSKAIIKIINDYAIENNLIIYTFDTKLDGGYIKKNWNYSLDFSISITSDYSYANNLNKLYVDLITTYLFNIKTLYTIESGKYVNYVDSNNNEIKVNLMQVPYLLLYNKDYLDKNNNPSPIVHHIEQMYTLSEENLNYIYKENNYTIFTNSLINLINEYKNI